MLQTLSFALGGVQLLLECVLLHDEGVDLSMHFLQLKLQLLREGGVGGERTVLLADQLVLFLQFVDFILVVGLSLLEFSDADFEFVQFFEFVVFSEEVL
jgi:hypothetical protein